MANQFHYYRLTEDDRILWGGYDAIYYFGGKVTKELEQRPETWAKLAEHFFTTFPQLDGVQFSHAWGGVIDTSHPLLPVLGHGDEGQGGVLPRLHRPRRGRDAVRGRGHARPARRPALRGGQPGVRPQEAPPLPARAHPLRRASRPPAGRSTAPTAAAATATSGSAPSTASASASIADSSSPASAALRLAPTRSARQCLRPRCGALGSALAGRTSPGGFWSGFRTPTVRFRDQNRRARVQAGSPTSRGSASRTRTRRRRR